MIDFLAGALMLTYLLAAAYFVRFWRSTGDRLFVYFAIAFGLMAANQLALFVLGEDEPSSYAYVLRVAGFILILFGIISKNLLRDPNRD